MAKKIWDAVAAIVVALILLCVLVQALQPYLWIVGVGTALAIVGLVFKVLLLRRKPW